MQKSFVASEELAVLDEDLELFSRQSPDVDLSVSWNRHTENPHRNLNKHHYFFEHSHSDAKEFEESELEDISSIESIESILSLSETPSPNPESSGLVIDVSKVPSYSDRADILMGSGDCGYHDRQPPFKTHTENRNVEQDCKHNSKDLFNALTDNFDAAISDFQLEIKNLISDVISAECERLRERIHSNCIDLEGLYFQMQKSKEKEDLESEIQHLSSTLEAKDSVISELTRQLYSFELGSSQSLKQNSLLEDRFEKIDSIHELLTEMYEENQFNQTQKSVEANFNCDGDDDEEGQNRAEEKLVANETVLLTRTIGDAYWKSKFDYFEDDLRGIRYIKPRTELAKKKLKAEIISFKIRDLISLALPEIYGEDGIRLNLKFSIEPKKSSSEIMTLRITEIKNKPSGPSSATKLNSREQLGDQFVFQKIIPKGLNLNLNRVTEDEGDSGSAITQFSQVSSKNKLAKVQDGVRNLVGSIQRRRQLGASTTASYEVSAKDFWYITKFSKN